jgi:hypothetical protein
MLQSKRFQKNNRGFFIIRILLALFLLMVLSFACKNNPIKPEQWQINLTLVETSCTEAYLKMQVGAELSERTVILKRDNVELWTRSINATELTITDTNLIPGHTYTYTASLTSPPPIWVGSNSSSQVQLRTMDTTSHDFTWQTYTFGGGAGSSVLYDVATIGDTAWAVGEIYLAGKSIPYCLAQWDGTNWSLKRLYYYNSSYGTTMPLYSVKGIFAFSTTDIWLAAGSIFHWNGRDSLTEFSFNRLTLPDPNATIDKLWGISSSLLYGVGNAGTIVAYNGNWTKIEGGTNTGIHPN